MAAFTRTIVDDNEFFVLSNLSNIYQAVLILSATRAVELVSRKKKTNVSH
jgi:hypothetical protein